MPMPPRFDRDQILDATLALVAEGGREAGTVTAVADRLGAASGSIYHRFAGREALLAEAWLRAVERFQTGYLHQLGREPAAQAALGAAHHVVAWARDDVTAARVLLLHRREQLLASSAPAELRDRARDLNRDLETALDALRRRLPDDPSMRRVRFAVIDIPYAAVRPDLIRGRAPDAELDQLVDGAVRALLTP